MTSKDRNSFDGRSVKLDRPTKIRTALRLANDENSSYDRVKTEPDYVDNKLSSGSRLDQIKGKYGFKRERSSSGLSEINSQNLMNLHNLRIRQVDSPINSLQKGRQNFEFAQALDSVNLREPSIKTPGSVSQNTLIDPRIQNIDKINSKIKNILSSFDRIEQELLGNNREERTRKHNLLAPTNTEKQVSYQKDFDKRIKEATENVKNNNNRLIEQYYSNKFDSKSKTSHTTNNIQRFSDDGYAKRKQIDSQIQAINDRIERRRLSTNYSDYSTLKGSFASNSQTNLTIVATKPQKPTYEAQPLAYQTFKKESRDNIENQEIRDWKDFKEKQNKEQFQHKPRKQEKEYKDFKKEARELHKEKKQTKQVAKSPNQHIVLQKTETKRFFKALKEQVELDEQYRNRKYAFKQIRDQDKLSQLISELVALGVRIQSREQLTADLKISEDEFNPFYTCRQNPDLSSIAKAYAEAKEHWQKQILGAFKRAALDEQGFSDNSIDLDRKGYMTIEDFVRLLNLQADAFVRNRDLVLIYRRLTAGKQLRFNDLLDQICCSQSI